MEFFWFVGWIIFTCMNYKIAAERGRDKGAAVIVSLLLSPVTSYLYLIAVPVQDKNLEVD